MNNRSRYPKAIAAASAASDAIAQILAAVHDEDAIVIDDTVAKLADATKLMVEIEDRPEHAELYSALLRFLEERG